MLFVHHFAGRAFGLWQWAATSNVFGHSSAAATPFQVVDSLHDLSVSKLSGLGLLEHLWISTRRVHHRLCDCRRVWHSLGLFMAFNETFRAIVGHFDMFKPMPPLAWISVAILWFGIGEAPKIFIIVIGSFVPVVLNSYSCLQLIEPEFFDVVRIIGGKPLGQKFALCAFPVHCPPLRLACKSPCPAHGRALWRQNL